MAKNDDDFERIMFELSERYEPRDADSHFELALTKDRRMSRLEQKYADEIANLTTKERLEMSNKTSLNHNLFQNPPLTSRSISGLSSSTISSEPSTPTNSQLPSSFSDKLELGSIDKSPTFISHSRLSETEFLPESPSENPPLPPRSKDVHRNEFNFHSPVLNECFPISLPMSTPPSIISPRLPPRLPRGAGPPPIPTRHSKD